MIHRKTSVAMSIVTAGGWIGGYIAGHGGNTLSLIGGMVVMVAFGVVAFWYRPDAETIAVQWRESENA